MAEAKTGNDDVRSEPAPAALNSWKEIAGYLKIDVRTCQRWEQSLGFPVHRIGNSLRSRVVAYPAEIEEWRKNTVQVRDRQGNGEPARNGNGLRAAINGNGSRSKFKPKHLLIFLVPVLAVTAAFLLEPYFDRNPVDFRISGPSLIILNKHGRELWAFDTGLEKHVEESEYRIAFPEKTNAVEPERGIIRYPKIMICDLDSDGRKEVLFAPASADELDVGKLLLFNSRGILKWEFKSGREIQVGERRYPPDFVINILELSDLDGDGRLEILIGAHSYQEAPTQFIILDLDKHVRGEYWNFGQLSDVSVRRRDGRTEIILLGTNNEYGQACLVVLDAGDIKGTSPQSPAFRFAGLPEGSARFYIRCLDTEIDRLISARGIFKAARVMRNSHVVVETAGNYVWYDFDADMNMPQVTVTDAMRAAWRENFQKGLISRPLDPEALRKELEAGVLYYDGISQSWVNRRATANPRPDLPKR